MIVCYAFEAASERRWRNDASHVVEKIGSHEEKINDDGRRRCTKNLKFDDFREIFVKSKFSARNPEMNVLFRWVQNSSWTGPDWAIPIFWYVSRRRDQFYFCCSIQSEILFNFVVVVVYCGVICCVNHERIKEIGVGIHKTFEINLH